MGEAEDIIRRRNAPTGRPAGRRETPKSLRPELEQAAQEALQRLAAKGYPYGRLVTRVVKRGWFRTVSEEIACWTTRVGKMDYKDGTISPYEARLYSDGEVEFVYTGPATWSPPGLDDTIYHQVIGWLQRLGTK